MRAGLPLEGCPAACHRSPASCGTKQCLVYQPRQTGTASFRGVGNFADWPMTYEEMEKEFGGGAKSGDAKGDCDSDAKASSPAACPLPTNPDGTISSKPPAPPEDHTHVYHLCRKQDWEAAKESQSPYFPRTFLKDGKFTRASLYLDDIADVANEYYSKASPIAIAPVIPISFRSKLRSISDLLTPKAFPKAIAPSE